MFEKGTVDACSSADILQTHNFKKCTKSLVFIFIAISYLVSKKSSVCFGFVSAPSTPWALLEQIISYTCFLLVSQANFDTLIIPSLSLIFSVFLFSPTKARKNCSPF